MKHKETGAGLFSDGHHVGDGEQPLHLEMDRTGLLRAERAPKTITFDSKKGESFTITVGEHYSVRYSQVLKEAYGEIAEVSGLATVVDRHLTISEAKFTLLTHNRTTGELPYDFRVSYIPGMKLMHGKELIYELQPEEVRAEEAKVIVPAARVTPLA
jgi:hypothetical protein